MPKKTKTTKKTAAKAAPTPPAPVAEPVEAVAPPTLGNQFDTVLAQLSALLRLPPVAFASMRAMVAATTPPRRRAGNCTKGNSSDACAA